jgi:hypothetical protein
MSRLARCRACSSKCVDDLTQYYNNLNALVASTPYQQVVVNINILLAKVLALPEVQDAKFNTPEQWAKTKLFVLYFVGKMVEHSMDKRFSKQLPGKQNLFAWLERNKQLDVTHDYIAGFLGQLFILDQIKP